MVELYYYSNKEIRAERERRNMTSKTKNLSTTVQEKHYTPYIHSDTCTVSRVKMGNISQLI